MGSCRLKHLQKTLASFAQHAQLAQRAACYLIWKALSGSVFMAILVVYTSNRYTFLPYEAASNWARGIVLYSRRSTRLGRFILRPSTLFCSHREVSFLGLPGSVVVVLLRNDGTLGRSTIKMGRQIL